jgi:hypothetical protein
MNARSFPNEVNCNQWCDFFHSSWNLQLYFFFFDVEEGVLGPEFHLLFVDWDIVIKCQKQIYLPQQKNCLLSSVAIFVYNRSAISVNRRDVSYQFLSNWSFCEFNQYKLNTCLFQTNKLVPRIYCLDRFTPLILYIPVTLYVLYSDIVNRVINRSSADGNNKQILELRKKLCVALETKQPTLHRKLKIQLLQLPCKHVVFLWGIFLAIICKTQFLFQTKLSKRNILNIYYRLYMVHYCHWQITLNLTRQMSLSALFPGQHRASFSVLGFVYCVNWHLTFKSKLY